MHCFTTEKWKDMSVNNDDTYCVATLHSTGTCYVNSNVNLRKCRPEGLKQLQVYLE